MYAVCPHCQKPGELTEVHAPEVGPVLHCPNPQCPFPEVPRPYTDGYADHLPCQVSIVGLTGHGKTVYLDAVLQEVAKLGGQWAGSGFCHEWLDEAQMRLAKKRIQDLRAGRLPKSTKSVLQRPQIVRLSHVPRVGGCQLVLFDTGGETFRSTEGLAEAGRYVVHSPAVVWLLSLNPNEPEPGLEYAHEILNVYLLGMARLGGRPREQDLVIALTKGDELLARPDLPTAARNALYAPSYNPAGGIWGTLEEASDELKRWLAEDCGYHDLVNLAAARFRSVRYCITSAQGAPAADRQLDFEPMPRGVLAPLLWLWRLARTPAWVGDDMYLDLPAAVAAAADGGTVRLDPGAYRLPAPFALRRPVVLAGAGAGRTTLETTNPGYGLGVMADGRVTLRDLTVRHSAALPADVIRATRGELALEGVTVTGGRGGDHNGRKVSGFGVVVARQATAVVTGGKVGRNAGNGLAFVEGGGGTATGATFEHNGRAGVFTSTTGAVTVTRSACRDNETGAWLHRLGSGLFDEVVCERNDRDGMVLGGGVGPAVVVRGGGCTGNGQDGVSVRAGAAPTVTAVACTGNGRDGVRVIDAAPVLEQVTASQNAGCGVLYEGTTSGAARKTTACGNGGDGVRVTGPTGPRLEHPDSRNNRGYGVTITDPASTVGFTPKGAALDGNEKGAVSDARPKRWFGGGS